MSISKLVYLLLCLSFSLLLNAQRISEKNIRDHIRLLSSDEMKGRATGSKEEQLAADYIAAQFKKYGLTPKGNNETYFCNYTFKHNANPHDTGTANAVDKSGVNVAGYLDNQAAFTIIIGAHFDHLGLGHDKNSLDANPEGKIHNGADDNASGVAGVIELANYFCNNKLKENYNFLFLCFSGEELGLFGSKKYCDNPTIDLNSVNLMLNMDMIGRLNDSTNKLMIYGIGTSPGFVPSIEKCNKKFSLVFDSSGIGPSDHTSFYLKNIPVLHFFTGQHSDYHKPGDDFEKINSNGEVQVLELITDILLDLNTQPKLEFRKTRAPATTSKKFKVTLGIMPDYTFENGGVRVDGVTDGKPAHIAGLIKGDIIIKLGDAKTNNVMDYMKALAEYNKGDTTTVTVKRNEEVITFKVIF